MIVAHICVFGFVICSVQQRRTRSPSNFVWSDPAWPPPIQLAPKCHIAVRRPMHWIHARDSRVRRWSPIVPTIASCMWSRCRLQLSSIYHQQTTCRTSYHSLVPLVHAKLSTFAISGPKIWKSLPDYLKDSELSTDILKPIFFASY